MRLTTALIADHFDGEYKWRGCTIGSDGFLYGVPSNAAQILKIDPTDDSATLVGPDLGAGGWKCLGCITGPDGYVYVVPCAGRGIFKFNPATEEITMLGELTQE